MPWLYENSNILIALDNAKPYCEDSQLIIEGLIEDSASAAYDIQNWPGYSAYLFNENPSQRTCVAISQISKIELEPLARMHFAWPIDIIVNEFNSLIGYIINKALNVVPLLSILKSSVPVSYEKRICIAKNICIAFEMFQKHNFIFGNLNIKSVFVDRNSCRVFLDPFTDTRFIDDEGETYYNAAYRIEYLAPEIHAHIANCQRLGSSANTVQDLCSNTHTAQPDTSWLNKNTDLFSLGVLLFALVNNNKHPLSCIIEGDDAINIFDDESNLMFQNLYISSLMAGIRPRTSIHRKTFGVFNYRLFWFRGKGAGLIFDRCFMYDYYSAQPRPTSKEWYSLMDKKSKGFKVFCLRFVHAVSEKLGRGSTDSKEPVTNFVDRAVLTSQYPTDLIGSDSISSPRIFWRTTFLFMLAYAVCSVAACFCFGIAWINIWAVFFGSFLGYCGANCLISQLRKKRGYSFKHYVLSVLSVVIVSIVCVIFAGGIL